MRLNYKAIIKDDVTHDNTGICNIKDFIGQSIYVYRENDFRSNREYRGCLPNENHDYYFDESSLKDFVLISIDNPEEFYVVDLEF